MTSPSTRVAGDFRGLAPLADPLRRHRAITHLVIAATALAVVVGIAIPTAPAIQAGLAIAPSQGSILPANIGVGVASTDSVKLTFPGPMDRAAVQASLGLAPGTRIGYQWSPDSTSVALIPHPRWATDERYVVHLPAGTRMADGVLLAADWRASFTTQAAPRVVQIQVGAVDGTPMADTPLTVQDVMASAGSSASGIGTITDDGAADASAAPAIGLTFSAAMDQAATARAFRLSPAVAGTFHWEGTTLWFVPDGRLVPGTRYGLTVAGARDLSGNRLGGDASFSFTTRAAAVAMSVNPAIGARGVSDGSVQITFSLPMDLAATAAAFVLTDTATGQPVPGELTWSADGRTLTFAASAALVAGRTYAAGVGANARDADGNPVTFSWDFTTAGPAPVYSPVPAAPASADMVQYALGQVNAARASYGLAPLVLDSAITAVAYGHAADMLAYGYFSHTSLDGRTYKQRLTAGGISYGWSGENICYLGYGGGVAATLDWCHAQFWAEPYPGGGNHKDNILNANFRRIGIGIASGGNKVYVVWDFTD